jgi:hypothetical protein
VHLIPSGQFKGKSGALSNLTYYIDITPVTFDNAVHHRQPKAQTLAFTLGSKKGFKYMGQIFFANATTCVNHAN